MKTVLLDRSTWDLVVDVSNNIASASTPYSLAQDAASAIKTFAGEVWYDTTIGMPYFQQILGRLPNIPLLKAKMVQQALTVPGVVSAVVYLTSIDPEDRSVHGQVQVTDKDGVLTAANF